MNIKTLSFMIIFAMWSNTSFANEDEIAHLKEIADLDQKTLDQAEMLFFSAISDYNNSKFDIAAEKFQKAFLLTKHRDLLYNIARSREKMNDKNGAVEWYRVYLGTKPSDTTATIYRIKQLGGVPTPLNALPGKNTGPKKDKIIEEESSGPVPWILAGVSVLSAGAGIYLGMNALENASSARDSNLRSTAEKFKEDSESQSLYADVSFLVSSVALAGSIYLFLDSDSKKQPNGKVNVMPSQNGGYIQYILSF